MSDDTACGGAHPQTSLFALVYDLRTGAPVNWQRLLTKSLARSATLDEAQDGTKIGVITSPVLDRLFIEALVKDGNPECREALRGYGLTYILWPDAKGGGLAIAADDVPFADGPCQGPETLPMATLRTLGVDRAFLASIEAAHATKLFGAAPGERE